jgi:3-hydroxy-D-aspartate aldolase
LPSPRGVNLRPHVKTHKSVEIARRQVAAGAIGVSCVTLGEAEVMVAGGIPGVLITSPAVTPSKIARLVKLAQRARPGDVMVVVDNPRNLADLAQAASELTHPLDVLVDYGAGYNRTGRATQAKVLELAALVAAEPRLRLRGLQSYAGNLQHIVARDKRSAAAAGLRETVAGIVAAAKRAGPAFEIVTGAGTGTHDLDSQDNAFTELQAGSYVFMDAEYTQVLASGGSHRPSRSRCSCRRRWSAPTRRLGDGGRRHQVLLDRQRRTAGGARRRRRHALRLLRRRARQAAAAQGAGSARPVLGARVEFVTPHCDPTVNLHDTLPRGRGRHAGGHLAGGRARQALKR